jgi:hypothetical protein
MLGGVALMRVSSSIPRVIPCSETLIDERLRIECARRGVQRLLVVVPHL